METSIETLQQQLKEQEKLAALGTLSAGIAHEIQNPLNFVINFSKMSKQLLTDLTEIVEDNEENIAAADREEMDDIMADLKENMQKIAEHGERAISIIQGILLASRGKENEFIPTDVCRLVKEYVWLSYHALRATHKNFNITIREQYQPDIPPVTVIPQDLSRAILNLMNNACYTVWNKSQQDGNAEYTPTIEVGVSADSRQLSIVIEDNGEGMDDVVKERLYENFFTTKPIGQGTGLGMAITRDIVENKHGGSLTFESEVNKGTRFTITLPIKKA
ncbi:MAG: GHKL domain-containing protein [Prevotella sp.]|nr:GHKL domain-containing protein [Prevotella sp.]